MSGSRTPDFAELARSEADFFWFRARNRLIIWAVGKYCPALSSFLEIGCGTGYVLSGLSAAFPGAKLYGSEMAAEGLKFAVARLPHCELMQMDARNIPFTAKFDAIGAFDVLEHIEEDARVLAEAHKALKPGGKLFITVPQHAWLWSPIDDYSCHYRRYSAKELHEKLNAAGFNTLRSTSFVSSLLPAMFLSRSMSGRKAPQDASGVHEFAIPGWLNRSLEIVLNAENGLIRRGMNFPAGGSRLVVAMKK